MVPGSEYEVLWATGDDLAGLVGNYYFKVECSDVVKVVNNVIRDNSGWGMYLYGVSGGVARGNLVIVIYPINT